MTSLTVVPASFSRPQVPRTAAWLPWLAMALILCGLLWPDSISAGRLLFQSPQSPPGAPTARAEQPQPATQVPQPPPATVPPAAVSPAAEPQGQPLSATPTRARTPVRRATATRSLSRPATQTPADPQSSRSVINWAKFWDTLAVVFAYPWLCCGIASFLVVPMVLLYLEIKGRRRPSVLPESLRRKDQ